MPHTPKKTLYVYPNPTAEDADWCVISEHPVFGEHQAHLNDEGDQLDAVAVPFEEIPDLIRDLRLAYNNHKGLPDPASFNTYSEPHLILKLRPE